MRDRPRPYLFFGKLPAHSDFVRYNASGDDVRAMESWIDEGVYRADHHFGNRWDAVYQSAAPHFFLFDPENGESVMTGILKPSRDRSGRKYPFVVARRIEAAQARKGPAFALPMAFGAVLADLENLALDHSETLPLAEISSRLERMAGPVSPTAGRGDFERYLRSTTVDDLWDSICADSPRLKKRVLEGRVLELARILRASGSVPRALGMRFPLSRGLAARLPEVCFWTKCVLTARGNPEALPSIFWPASAEKPSPCLFVYLVRPSPRAFLSLMDPDADQDMIFRTDAEEREAAGESGPDHPPGDGALARPEGMTLDEFLGRQ